MRRHPFPGPGLGVRILGEVTEEKCDILREADAIFIGELRRAGPLRQDLAGLLRAPARPLRGRRRGRAQVRLDVWPCAPSSSRTA